MKFLLTSIEAEHMFSCSSMSPARLPTVEWPIGIFHWLDGLRVLTAGHLMPVAPLVATSVKRNQHHHAMPHPLDVM